MTVVPPGTEHEFLAPLEVRKLWGIGPKASEKLVSEGIETIGDLTGMSEEWFRARFGKNGPHLRQLALGIDDRPIVVSREAKSASAETTMAEDTGNPDVLYELIARLSQRVAGQLESANLRGRTVKLKLRLADYTTFTRQTTIPYPDNAAEVMADVAGALLKKELRPDREFRLIGVGMSGFDHQKEISVEEPMQGRLAGF